MNKISSNNAYVIKDIAKQLPTVTYETIDRQPREWKRRVINLLGRLWLTRWFNRWYFFKYVGSKHQVNHERRLRRTYMRHGVEGVLCYLLEQKVEPESAAAQLRDFDEFIKDKSLTTPMRVIRD